MDKRELPKGYADMIDLHYGDCLDVMTWLPDQVDMVLCDLPYGSTNCAWDCQIDLAKLWAVYRQVCKPGAPIILFAQTPFDKVLGASNLPWLRYEWIWEKTHATGHLNANRAPMKAHENILVFCSQQPPYFPIKTTGHKRKVAVAKRDVSPVYGKQNYETRSYDSTERFPRSVIVGPSDKQKSKLHRTQKPAWLCEYLIRTHSNPGAVVLDNCMGSGTTGVAALNLDRHFIGIEKDPVYFEIAKQRIEETKKATERIQSPFKTLGKSGGD